MELQRPKLTPLACDAFYRHRVRHRFPTSKKYDFRTMIISRNFICSARRILQNKTLQLILERSVPSSYLFPSNIASLFTVDEPTCIAILELIRPEFRNLTIWKHRNFNSSTISRRVTDLLFGISNLSITSSHRCPIIEETFGRLSPAIKVLQCPAFFLHLYNHYTPMTLDIFQTDLSMRFLGRRYYPTPLNVIFRHSIRSLRLTIDSTNDIVTGNGCPINQAVRDVSITMTNERFYMQLNSNFCRFLPQLQKLFFAGAFTVFSVHNHHQPIVRHLMLLSRFAEETLGEFPHIQEVAFEVHLKAECYQIDSEQKYLEKVAECQFFNKENCKLLTTPLSDSDANILSINKVDGKSVLRCALSNRTTFFLHVSIEHLEWETSSADSFDYVLDNEEYPVMIMGNEEW
ncbi:hypothetical protein M3Y94_00734400 [Aphelenchoides besseyi]|nr:hypothetical protein M3Y94_00734400 [Aphelenchoides besseyi]